MHKQLVLTVENLCKERAEYDEALLLLDEVKDVIDERTYTTLTEWVIGCFLKSF